MNKMSRPPTTPARSKKGIAITYFEKITEEVIELYKKSIMLKPLNIDFKGYRNLLNEYRNLNINDKEEAWKLARDLNLWAEYVSGIMNVIQKDYADMESEKMKILSIASYDADSTKVANGKRLANKDERVVQIRKERNLLKVYYEALLLKIEFLNRAHYNCKSTFELLSKYESKK